MSSRSRECQSQSSRIALRSAELFREIHDERCRRTDRMFVRLMGLQWVGGILLACFLSPRTWIGAASAVHIHVWAAVLLGGLVSAAPVAMAMTQPGTAMTRHTIAFAQALWSALLIHVSGGRLETHFHVFGSLAFLAFYRDWRVLITNSAVVALDHMVRGYLWPESVYGVSVDSSTRWVEHTGWVVFEDVFLIASCLREQRQIHEISTRRAALEATNAEVEQRVSERTAELQQTSERLKAEHAAHRRTQEHRAELYAEIAAISQRAQQESERLLSAIASLLIRVDEHGIVDRWNGKVEEIVRIGAENAIGRRFDALDIAWTQPEAMRQIWTVQDSRHIATGFRDPDGRLRFLDLQLSPVFEEGIFRGVLILGTDMTERRELEQQLNHAQKLEAVGQLAAGVAHEINTPMQYIGDNVQYVKTTLARLAEQFPSPVTGPDTERGASVPGVHRTGDQERERLTGMLLEALDDAEQGVHDVSRIVAAMKEFSHPGQDGIGQVDINHALESTLIVARNEWKYVAETQTNLDPELPPVLGSAGELNQVFVNLLINAAHAISDATGGGESGRGLIRVTTRRDGEFCRISVQDTGTGIPDAIGARIFDPFFTTKEVGKGTGQGLAIAHQIIVQKHGGRIWYESEPGQGTTFHILLPLRDDASTECSELSPETGTDASRENEVSNACPVC